MEMSIILNIPDGDWCPFFIAPSPPQKKKSKKKLNYFGELCTN